jgi:hypothetical protein
LIQKTGECSNCGKTLAVLGGAAVSLGPPSVHTGIKLFAASSICLWLLLLVKPPASVPHPWKVGVLLTLLLIDVFILGVVLYPVAGKRTTWLVVIFLAAIEAATLKAWALS